MSYEAIGKLHKKFDTENKTSTFQAREFVLEIADGNYPQMIKFQLTQDRCALLDTHEEGDTLKVHFDLRGREWNEKYFTNLNAWRIEKPENAAPVAKADDDTPVFNDEGSFPSASDAPPASTDDLPF